MRAPPRVKKAVTTNYTMSGFELLTDVDLTTGSVWRSNFVINPRKSCFKVLSTMSLCYEMYRFNSLVFEYEPTCGNTTSGTMVMFLDYDPSDDNTGCSYQELTQMAGAVVGQVSSRFSVAYRPNMTVINAHRYFNQGGSTPDRLADCVRIWMMTDGPTAFARCGKVYMRYNVTLYNQESPPQTMPSTAFAKPSSESYNTSSLFQPIGNPSACTLTSSINGVDLAKVIGQTVDIAGQSLRVAQKFGLSPSLTLSTSTVDTSQWTLYSLPVLIEGDQWYTVKPDVGVIGAPNTASGMIFWDTDPDYVTVSGILYGDLDNNFPATTLYGFDVGVWASNGWQLQNFTCPRLLATIAPTESLGLALTFEGHFKRTLKTQRAGGCILNLIVRAENGNVINATAANTPWRVKTSSEIHISPTPYLG